MTERGLSRAGLFLAGIYCLAACGGSDSGAPGTAGNGATAAPGAGTGASAGTTAANPGSTAGTSSPSAGGGATPGSAGSGTNGGTPGASAGAGTSAGGNAGTPGSAGGPAAPSGTVDAMDSGNYFVSGSWHGYAWASAQGMGSTVMPMDFSAQTTGMPRCIQGSVAATTDYSGNAILGLNLNQEMGTNAPLMTVTPTKAGIMLDVKNTGASPLRFQVQTPTGGMNETWCIDVSGNGGFIPWTSLKTECWGSTGQAYANEPISAAMILVPGGTMAAVNFDFCINSIAEADGPAGGASGEPAAGSGAPMAGNGGMASGGAGAGMSPPPIQGGCMGFATRYWDCCKAHCGWSGNVPGGANPIPSCDASDNMIGDADARSSCDGGSAHLCHSMVPWAASDQLSYGFSAVAASGTDICGKCYQLQFTGVSHNAGEDPGSTALAGKTMIVQAINIGGDVGSGQFDISIPGGGVGMFNACSAQWGVDTSELGQTYGGFLPRCKEQHGRTNHEALKQCVLQSCQSVFESRGLTELAAGCKWFVDWFQVADNPSVMYKEVECPQELLDKGGVRRPGGAGNACVM